MDIGEWLQSLPFADQLDEIGGVLLQLLLVLVVTVLAWNLAQRLVDGVIGRLLDRESLEGTAQELSAIEVQKRKDTLSGLGGALLRLFIVVIGALMALRALMLDIGPAIAGLGVAGLAISLGAQSLVRDYIAGAFILIENQFAKGDMVKVVDITGTVEDFNLRRTSIRDADGTLFTVPNGLITTAGNLTRVWARINVDVTVPHAADLAAATAALDAAGAALGADPAWARRVLEAPRVDRIDALTPQGVTLKMLGTVRAVDRWSASGELRRRVVQSLAEAGIALG